ncbi:acyltransferase family protein [Helicobacter monodelphidis]|uniref:acyltransferase family protein n=1 Tax=Helicobacter sp. 15-1451 TaxID=2004995 RepID=UPI0015ECA335|nr:acyltransferase [Helicobacter sp. 15-1451]
MKSSDHFIVLDSFRGIAALCVVLFHIHFNATMSEWKFFEHSFYFVDFFFILSGFVITYAYDRENFSFKNFLYRRSLRILPLYLFMFVLFLAFECSKAIAYQYGFIQSVPFVGANATSEILPHLFLLQSWLSFANPLSFNSVAWSLSVEYYLYIFFGISIFLFFKIRLLIFSVLFLVSSLEFTFLTTAVLEGIYYFSAGIFCCYLYRFLYSIQIQNIFSFWVYSLMESLILVIVYFVIVMDYREWSVVAFSFLILIFVFSKGIFHYFFKNKLFVFIGNISYSIYMTHTLVWMCIVIICVRVARYFGVEILQIQEDYQMIDTGLVWLNWVLVLLSLGAIIICSSLTYRYIEKYFMQIR